MKLRPPSTSGRRGSTTTMSGWHAVARSRADLGQSGAADDQYVIADGQQPGQALANPLVGVDDEDAEWPIGPGRGFGHDLMVRAAARAGESDLRPRLPSAERPLPATSSVADRGCLGPRRPHASPGRRPTPRPRRSASASGDEPTSIVVPSPGRLSQANRAPIRSARARMPARPRWPSGTVAGSNPLPSSSTRSRTPPSTAADLDADLAGAGVLDDVVERLLGDPVEHLLDRQRQPVLEVALDDDRQAEPALQRRGVGLERTHQAVLLEVAGAQLEDQRAHLGQRLALQLAELGRAGSRAASGSVLEQQLDRARHEGHREERLGHRVVQLAGQVRPLLAGRQLPGLAAQLALEADLVADVPGRALDACEPAVDGDADRAHVDRASADRRSAQDLGRLDLLVRARWRACPSGRPRPGAHPPRGSSRSAGR